MKITALAQALSILGADEGGKLSPSVFLDQVLFMKAMENEVGKITPTQANLYANLSVEETFETFEAISKPEHAAEIKAMCKRLHEIVSETDYSSFSQEQRAEILDGIMDSVVTLSGLGISLDLPLDLGWAEVFRSNMAKINPDGSVTRRPSDGKVMKPEGWTPPDLLSLVRSWDELREE